MYNKIDNILNNSTTLEIVAVMQDMEIKKKYISAYIGISPKGLYNNKENIELHANRIIGVVMLNTKYYRAKINRVNEIISKLVDPG